MAARLRVSSSSSKFLDLIIANLMFTDVKLGKGADATVYEISWNGTLCAAKRLHEILLEDESAGGVAKLIGNFEVECLTWSKLRHPGVVQFLGVHIEGRSLLPVLVMEKMDTSLRTYLEDHSKEEFPIQQKAFVLCQVTQALAYLHNQTPPLVHHDLSSNNVLLNVVSFVAKISDFGMSRAINPSAFTRKSSIKGTLAFMAPEALQTPPRYNEKLDVFSFGNVILHTVTHEWPNPGPPTRYEGDIFVAVTELQRRGQCVELFTVQEKHLFLPIVRQCLENRPDKRPSSVMLVQELRRIESILPRGNTAAIEELRQQLSAKESECKKKDEVNREKDEVIKEKDEVIREKDEVIKEKDEVIREKDEVIKEKDEVNREKDEVIKEKDEVIREKDEALKKKDIVVRTMQADIQQLRSQNTRASEICQHLLAKEAERRQSEEVVREKIATIQAQQAEIQSIGDKPEVPQKVS